MKENLRKFMAGILAFLITAASAVFGTPTIRVTFCDSLEQEFSGWGTSACWWSQHVSDEQTRQELARQLYSEQGLGLNIYRYNVGGGVNPEHNRVSNPWRVTESFYYFNEQTGQYEYDFTRDENAVKFMLEALKYGCIDTVVFFANSPHYSMTVTGEASGGTEAYKTNILPEKYDDFVDYFLTITKHFVDMGVPVKYISPINEPQWSWGGDWVGQEGCHYEPDEVIELLRAFSKGIDRFGLDVKLLAPESGSVDGLTEEYFTKIAADEDIMKNLGAFAYHSYWADNSLRAKHNLAKMLDSEQFENIPVEMSEWCELPNQHDVDDIQAALIMSRVIASDIRISGVNAWSSWVAVNQTGIAADGNNYADGMFHASDDFSSYAKTRRYDAMAHYSKFVPAGSRVLKTNLTGLSFLTNITLYDYETAEQKLQVSYVAFKTPEGDTVIVLTNEGAQRDFAASIIADKAVVYTSDAQRSLEKTYEGKVPLKFTLPEYSITTIVFEK